MKPNMMTEKVHIVHINNNNISQQERERERERQRKKDRKREVLMVRAASLLAAGALYNDEKRSHITFLFILFLLSWCPVMVTYIFFKIKFHVCFILCL